MGAYGSPELNPKPIKESSYEKVEYSPKRDFSIVRFILWIIIIALMVFIFGLLIYCFIAII